ncbi:MAG: DM13 domain-containing protein [Candidatus Zambryskibacteria bacterium]|nr:DM13 domain-containing protein [Candidatus Zambryskibacteria bacterium]
MKKVIISIISVVILSIGYWLISPFFIDKRVSEEFPIEESKVESRLISQGSFAGFDRIHYGSGDLQVFKTEENYIIRFEENFNVANGPDLYVGFGKDGKYKKGTEISKLKGNIGSQNYVVPGNINLEDYNEIWVWCRAFSVGFAKAVLNSSI